MQRKQSSGIDTRMLIPVYVGIFCLISFWFLPAFSAPELRYEGVSDTYKLINMNPFVDNLQKFFMQGGKLCVNWLQPFMILGALVVSASLIFAMISIIRKSKNCNWFVKIAYALNFIFEGSILFISFYMNTVVNRAAGIENSFLNMTISAFFRPTSIVYANALLSLLMIAVSDRLFLTEEKVETRFEERVWKEDQKIGKRTLVAILILVLGIPFVIFFGIFFLNDRSNVFIGLCIILLASLPFLMVFEDRRPQARELILIAVLSAIAVVGRMAFFMLPQFKPMTAVVIIAGVGLGAEAGFLTGVVSGFVSNFFFGQGPWTPWQMFALGIIGFLAGIIFYNKKYSFHKLGLCIYGGIATFIIYGFIMDTASVLNVTQELSWQVFLASYVSGITFNAVHAISTIVFLYLLSGPIERKLNRVKKKYGILQC